MFAKNCLKCFRRCLSSIHISTVLFHRSLCAVQHSPYNICKESGVKIEEVKAKIIAKLDEELKQTRASYNRFEREFEELSLNKYEALIKTEEDRLKINRILEVYEYEKYTTAVVPKTLTLEQMKRLMSENEKKQIKTMHYLYKVEFEQRSDLLKRQFKARKKQEIEKINEAFGVLNEVGIHYDEETGAPIYGLWKNAMFTKFSNQKMDTRFACRLYDSCLFGQPLIFDFAFENEMDEKCLSNTIKQMAICFSDNRRADSPFSLWFCNLQRDSKTESKLLNAIGNLYPVPKMNTSFINVTRDSYLSVFPKNKLVYLTPDARDTLHQFDDDAVYIVGAFVDRAAQTNQRSSFLKAKREGLRTAKLPIREYVPIKGNLELTMDQMTKILVTIKETHCWKTALKHVPSRKVKSASEIEAEETRRLHKFKRKNLLHK